MVFFVFVTLLDLGSAVQLVVTIAFKSWLISSMEDNKVFHVCVCVCTRVCKTHIII